MRHPSLPVVNGRLVHTQVLCHLLLQEAQIKTSFPEVVSDRNELSWIGLLWWLRALEPHIAKCQ
jgi:hypothetical protein